MKMWGPAHIMSVGLPLVVILQLLASSHARPQTVHQVWMQMQSIPSGMIHCMYVSKRVQVASADRDARVRSEFVSSAVPNCDSALRRSLPECQQKVISLYSSYLDCYLRQELFML